MPWKYIGNLKMKLQLDLRRVTRKDRTAIQPEQETSRRDVGVASIR
jgi:hypothetical protein